MACVATRRQAKGGEEPPCGTPRPPAKRRPAGQRTMPASPIYKIRLPDDERAAMQAAADAAGLPLGAWLKRVGLLAAQSRVDPAELLTELRRIRRDLNSGVGNNLNQLAAGGQVSEAQLNAALSQLGDIRGRMRRLLR